MSQAKTAARAASAAVMMHFEIRAEAYELLKAAFDAIRKELDDGMFGEASEWGAIRRARGKLFAMGKLLTKELVIVKEDPVEDSKTTQGGKA